MKKRLFSFKAPLYVVCVMPVFASGRPALCECTVTLCAMYTQQPASLQYALTLGGRGELLHAVST